MKKTLYSSHTEFISASLKESSLPLILVSLVLGILTYIVSKSFFIFLPLICVVALILFLIIRSAYKQLIIIIAIFFIGFTNAKINEPFIYKDFTKSERDVKLTGTVLDYPSNKDKVASFILKNGDKKILIKLKDSLKKENKLLKEIEKGSIVEVEGKTGDIFKKFSDGSTYKNYLLNIGCNGVVVCEEDGLRSVKPPLSLIQKVLNAMRKFFLVNIDKASDNEAFNSFLKAIVIGENSISFNNRERFSELGIAHFLSISGMHFNILGAFILFIFILFSIKSPFKEILTISILTIFLLLIGFIPSAVRAYIMFSVAIIAPLIRRIGESFLGLCLASIILLLINPLLIKNIGFELSFIGTFALTITSNKLIYKGAIASLATIPLIAYHFNILSAASVLSNILLLPIFPIFYIYGLFVALFGFLNLSFLGKIIGWLWDFFIFLSDKIANFSFSYRYVADPNAFYVILFYSVFIAAGILWFYSDKEKKKLINRLVPVIAVLTVIFLLIPSTSSKFLKVQFIDVSEGDSALLRTPDGLNILIDGGKGKTEYSSYDYGERNILPLLKRNGINRLDLVILSHYHDDHYGGLISIFKHVPKVEKLILPKYNSEDRETFDSLFKELKKKPEVIYICGRRRLKLGVNTIIEFFSPSCDRDLVSKFSENSKSITLKLKYKEFSLLFTGDIEDDAEKWLLNEYGEELDSDILKVAHHGSRTSSSEAFLDTVTPEVAIISCGPSWIFKHPALTVINRLNERDIEFYTTYENGDIILYTNGYKYKVFGLKP